MAVHQLVPHFRIGDATAQAAVHFRALLRRLGHWGGLFSVSQEPGDRGAGPAAGGAAGAAGRPGPAPPRHRRAGSRRGCSTCPAAAAWCSTTSRRCGFYRGTSLEPLPARRPRAAVGHGAARGAGHRGLGLQLLRAPARGLRQRAHRAALRRARALRPGPRGPRDARPPRLGRLHPGEREPRGAAQALRGPARAPPGGAAPAARRAPARRRRGGPPLPRGTGAARRRRRAPPGSRCSAG